MVAGGASETGGVKPMVIAGRMVRERERLIGMSPEERAWRKQWLKDQELHHGPRKVPALELELNNPISASTALPRQGLQCFGTRPGELLSWVLCNQVFDRRSIRFLACRAFSARTPCASGPERLCSP